MSLAICRRSRALSARCAPDAAQSLNLARGLRGVAGVGEAQATLGGQVLDVGELPGDRLAARRGVGRSSSSSKPAPCLLEPLKAYVLWPATGELGAAWFWHRWPPVGAYVVARGSWGVGAHHGKSVFYVHEHE